MGNVERRMIKSYRIKTIAGEEFISDPVLAYTKLLFVAREGTAFDIVESDDPYGGGFPYNSRQVQHSNAFGFLRFAVPFNQGETVQIITGDI